MSKLNGKAIEPLIFKVNTADGDGVTTDFNLTGTPVATANLFVFIDGIKRTVIKDYTLSGSVVSFLSAPEVGQEIEFNYINKD
jgi:hypothetical protein